MKSVMNALTYRGGRFGLAWRMGWATFCCTFWHPYPWHEPKCPLFWYSAKAGWDNFLGYLLKA